MTYSLHKLVVVWLGDQVVNGKAAAYDVHETFVEFGCDGKQARVVGSS